MLLKLRIIFSILNIIYAILYRIVLLIRKKPQRIPPITDSLLTFSATALAKKIRQREITCYDVVNTHIQHIKKVNCTLNAVIDNRFDEAIFEANICDEQLANDKFDIKTLEKEKPLYGIPVTVKECCAVKGCSHTGCSLGRKGMKASYDALVIKLLRNAGAIPVCVTNTPEMCCGFESSNLLHGRTRNPYDTRYTSGGSSGGEGALLGAGASVIGIGSDLGGSVRLPALFNGIFGHKPTAEIISNIGHIPESEDKFYQKFLTFGPMTRYAEDLGVFMKVLTSTSDHNLRLEVPVDLRQLKVYYRFGMDDALGTLPVVPEIKDCVLKTVTHFTQYDIRPEKEISNLLVDASDPKLKKNPAIEILKIPFGLSQHTMQTTFFALMFETHFPFSESDISHYTKQGKAIRQKLLDLLGENGIFIYPTFRCPAIFSEFMLCETLNEVYCAIFNVFGFPAVHIPMGLNHEGLPIGVQVIAAPYQDRLCLAVAKELETAFGGWVPPSISLNN
ncbi:fatty-acid amide hydrolase 2-like isoform X2 [Camponotus floridanus]|uniref:fatty-acid amide hydrolase 2-like isoform X2 n=1 Tax=Camponotus floridanus TaxID=104421 RepID=UPI000DC6CD5E|nr:fatty-acid amide hydrolase 2-like isoform X2 [Camponotus floridanus]